MKEGTQKKIPDPQILKDLQSSDGMLVLKTLRKLRTSGNLTYIPEILKILNRSSNDLIEKELIRFLADIKEPGIIPLVVAGLKKPGLKAAHAGILSATWQSGLDYSRYIDLFIKLFLEGDYLVALESFTVIEQSITHLSVQEVEEERKHLLDGLVNVSEEKKPLARELVNLLQT